jgi:hypothetical protein
LALAPSRIAKTLILLCSTTLVVLGCGGGAGETTITIDDEASATTTVGFGAGETSTTLDLGGDATTTVPEVTTTADEGSGVGIEDIPPECVAMISEVLNAFEPAVEGIDWDTATIDDHLQVMMSLASVSIGGTTGCEDVQLDVTNEEGSALFLAVAQQEAPGAVAYFQAIIDINTALEGRQSSGNCQTDIATFEDVVAGGVPWVDLPLPEQWLVLNLMSSIGYCSLQTQGELRFRPEVEEFLAGSPFAGE